MINSQGIIFSNALLNDKMRKEIFSEISQDDFIVREALECYYNLASAFESGTIFDLEFKESMMMIHTTVIDPTIDSTVDEIKHAIKEQKKKVLRSRLADKMGKYRDAICDPAISIEEMQNYCKDIYDLASSATELTASTPTKAENITSSLKRMEDIKAGRIKYLSFNMPGLDHVKFIPGDLVVLAGRASSGKTAIALDFCRMSAIAGQSTAFICVESDSDVLYWRTYSQHSMLPFDRIAEGGKDFTTGEWNTFMKSVEEIKNMPMLIESHYKKTVHDIYRICKRLKKQGVEIIYIDYLQKILENPHSRSRHEAVAEISSELKNIALELDIVLVALTQLNRGSDQSTPGLSNLAESSRIEQDASVVLIIDRPDAVNPPPKRNYSFRGGNIDMKGLIALIIAKSRNGKTGIGFFEYEFSCLKLLKQWTGDPRVLRN